jgi:hypothetical protein
MDSFSHEKGNRIKTRTFLDFTASAVINWARHKLQQYQSVELTEQIL